MKAARDPADADLYGLLAQAGGPELTGGDETAWIEVIRRMDAIYADLVHYQVALEEKNARLENAQRFIESVISSMSDVLIVADTRGRIQQVNRALERLTGRAAADLVGGPLAGLFDPACAARVEDFAEHIRSGTVTDCEVDLRDARGEPTPIAINCTPRHDHDGRLSGLVVTGRPLGELHRAYDELQLAHERLKTTQQQLVQSEKMASLGQLVAGVAHELNNPISVVYGNMHALKRYEGRLARYLEALHGGTPPAQCEALRRELKIDRLLADMGPLIDGSLEGAGRVGDIVEELRRFSTPVRQGRQPFDLVRVIRTAGEWVGKARRVPPALELELPPRLPLDGYEGYTHQILVNLLQNAADAVEGRPAPRIHVRLEQAQGRARVVIHDNGPGFDESQRLRLFDPFFTTKPVGKGTGLGLAISYSLATETCGGRLSADNHPDGGARFTLELPLEAPA